jgi:polyhydroxybutyrate depolymerase
VDPSAGCGQDTRPNGGNVYVANKSWLIFPESYDGETPMPVIFGFHGCGDGNRGDATRTEYLDLTRDNVLGEDYIIAVPISADTGGCWNYGNDIPRVLELYDDLVANHCIDKNRVFATGHSSGAYFAVAILEAGHASDAEHLNMRGMAPVAASPVNNHATPMPVMYIENPADTARDDNNAPMVVAGFRSANMCDDTTKPYEGVDACNSSSGGAAVNSNCSIYDGCSQPTIWCSHNDQAYGTTGHGVPCFAAQAMDMFFKSL